MARSPIVSVLGHVDHGKSSILDSLRNTNIVRGEAGGITQAIGASIMPLDVILAKCGDLIKKLNMNLTIPGLLFIDTPGHAAFTSLRKRGGNLADIAIVVVDINEGFKPQTIEAIEILRSYKTPFIIAANKLDLVPGYVKRDTSFLKDFQNQSEKTKTHIEQKIYELVGSIHEKFGLESERFDRVSDYTKQISIIPCSAIKQIGLEEILMVLTGLAQKYLEKNLMLDVTGPGKGVILEVKETTGLGKTLDVILYDGSLSVGDNVVIGGMLGPVESKIKALFMPQGLVDMRDKKSKYKTVKKVVAATGVKMSCSNLDDVVAGMPIQKVEGNVEEVKALISKQVSDVEINTEKKGIVVKADTIGSLEALIKLLKDKNVPIRRASIGNITKKDISDVESNFEQDPTTSILLGFNIKEEDSTEKVKVIVKDVIYALIDEYEIWFENKRKEMQAKELDTITKPAIIEVLQNCIFRQSNPCILGVEVLRGEIKTGTRLINRAGDRLGVVKAIQSDNKSTTIAEKGRQVAISMPDVVAGRHVFEGDVFFSDINEEEFRKLKKLKDYLNFEEKEILKEIAQINRKQKPMWGI